MRITILLLIVGLCVVSAKYLPYESESNVLLRNKRSNSEESSPSSERNNDSNNNDEDDDNDDDDDSSNEKELSKQRRKEEEQRKKLEEKLAKEQRKQEQKREKEERKRLERLEKEKRKEEEKLSKILEKSEKEEKRRQEKQRKELEKLQKEVLGQKSNEDSFLETEEESSVELGSIWRNHIYMKYGLTFASTNAEKKAALDKYLKEELSLNSNSTQSERQQAMVKLIETRLQNDTASKDAIRRQLLNQINSVTINKLRNKLTKNIEKLNNKTEILNNVTLPWASIAQQTLEEKKTFLHSISQFLSNLLPNWVPEAQIPNSNSSVEQTVQFKNNETSLSGSKDNNSSGVNEISADINIASGQPHLLSPPGSSVSTNTKLPDPNSNVIVGNNIISSQDLAVVPSNTNIAEQGNGNVTESNKNIILTNNSSSNDGLVILPADTLKSDSNGVDRLPSDPKLNNNEINKPSSFASNVVLNANGSTDNMDNSAVNIGTDKNIEVKSQEKVNAPSNNLDGVTSINDIIAIESGVIPNEISVPKNISAAPANNEILINSSVLDYIDGTVSSVGQISESTIVPSPYASTSNVSGQPPSNEGNVLSVDSSLDDYKDSNIINQSAKDIAQPNPSSVSSSSLNNVPISEPGVIVNEISVSKNINKPAKKEILINSDVLGSIDGTLSSVNKIGEATVAPPISMDSSVSNGLLPKSENLSPVIIDSNLQSSIQISESGVISNGNSVSKDIGSEPVNKETPTASNVLGSTDDKLSSVNKVSESTLAPSILVDTSTSNGQLPKSESLSLVSINENIIPLVSTSIEINKSSNINNQSEKNIAEPILDSVSVSKNIQTTEIGIISNDNIVSNISSKSDTKAAVSLTSNTFNKTSDVLIAEKLSKNIQTDVGTINNTASETTLNDNKSSVDNIVNAVSFINNSVSLESKLKNLTNSIDVNTKIENDIPLSNVNIESSLNNNINISSDVVKISAYPSEFTDATADFSTSNTSIVESTNVITSSVLNNNGDISSTVNSIDIVTNPPVKGDAVTSFNKTSEIISNENIKSLNISETSSNPSVSVALPIESKNKAPVNKVEPSNLNEISPSLEVKNVSLTVNDTSNINDVANIGVINETGIPKSVPSNQTKNDSSILNVIDVLTTDSSIVEEISPKISIKESISNTSSDPVVSVGSATVALTPEVSTILTTNVDNKVASSSSSDNISEIPKVAKNSSAIISQYVAKTESSDLSLIQNVTDQSATTVAIEEATTQVPLTESTILDLGAASTLSETISNTNTASSDLVTESSLLIVETAQNNVSQPLSTVVTTESSTLAQGEGVTLPAEPGASVVEILPQV